MRIHYAQSARSARATSYFLGLIFSLNISSITDVSHAQCPDPPTQIVETQLDDEGNGGASVAMRECGEYITVWERDFAGGISAYNNIDALRFDADGSAIGSITGLASITSGQQGRYDHPSVAISRLGRVYAAWVGVKNQQTTQKPSLHALGFDFDAFSFTPVTATSGRDDWNVSAGTSGANVDALAWANSGDFKGLEAQVIGAPIVELRGCDTICDIRRNQWSPCISVRSEDGYVAIVFAFDEQPTDFNPPRNIALVMMDAGGNVLADDSLIGTDINDPSKWVNDPTLEDPDPDFDSDQRSPAVSFVGDDIVVTWAGPNLADCLSVANVDHIYARRFKFNAAADPGQRLRDPNPATEGRAGIFIVDSGTDSFINGDDPNPAVALTLATDSRQSSFAVAWNANAVYTLSREEVRAQYFDSLGEPFGGPVRVNQATGVTDPDPGETLNIRRLDRSGSHTIALGKDGQLSARVEPLLTRAPIGRSPLPTGGCHEPAAAELCRDAVRGGRVRQGRLRQQWGRQRPGHPAVCELPDQRPHAAGRLRVPGGVRYVPV